MGSKEFRVLIKHCILIGKNTTQAKEWLYKCYGTSSLLYTTVKKLYAEFKCGHRIVSDDQRIKVSEIAHMVKISTERVGHILHEHLGMKKLSARWVQRFLTIGHK